LCCLSHPGARQIEEVQGNFCTASMCAHAWLIWENSCRWRVCRHASGHSADRRAERNPQGFRFTTSVHSRLTHWHSPQAFRRLSLTSHPDKSDAADAVEKFRQLVRLFTCWCGTYSLSCRLPSPKR
jgi:hypothetical protein